MKRTKSLKIYILASLFAALTAASAFIKLPTPWVPLTLQTLLVYLSGLLLGPWGGAMSQILYLLVGLAGLPVFTGGCGPTYVLYPTFGYLVGFIPASFTAGLLAERGGYLLPALGTLICVLVIYVFGVPYLYFSVNYLLGKEMAFLSALKIGFLIPIAGDIFKGGAALGIFYLIRMRMPIPISKR
ncbi:MAG: biotin transporter BioY [Deltaproteobacteria bacterium]|uniref:Biotin transporter n=1 Tax=Candidatus Zymogenus saltonus TaxID=2844893 RepID=A0A9D8KCR1_9DELT|nr:biotin transporter BioY [Candidatus Zymogenus saltonus]